MSDFLSFERSEESLIIRSTRCHQKPEMFRFAQHDKSLNLIHGVTASNVQSNHEQSTRFRQKPKRLASLKERIKRPMNNQNTYTLLVRSEERGRNVMETMVYALCVVSAIVAIGQFAGQSLQLSMDGPAQRENPVPVVSQHALEVDLRTES
jgi:hypothetical protein